MRRCSVKALTFDDVSGAYGAYSFYRQDGWPKADIGTGATSDNNRVLFWKGNTVVDATFSHVGPMSAGEMRELAEGLPSPQGNRALPPPILASLPQGSLEKQTTHFAQGPAGYAGAGGVLPAELVGFSLDAETVTANYALTSGTGNADADRLSDTAAGRGAGEKDPRIHKGRQRGSAGVSEVAGGFRPGVAGSAA